MPETFDNLYVLTLRDTPLWPSFGGNPDNFPKADRIQDYLTRKGVVFSPSGSVQVFTDGSVQVLSVTDPRAVWPLFDNAASQQQTVLEQRLASVLVLRNKLADGTATAADQRDALRLALTLILRLYQKD